MLPEDRLDALLSSRGVSLHPYTGQSDDDAALGPLLAAAAQLAVLAEARPTATFAQALEDRVLARAATLADASAATHIGYNTPTLPGSDFPTLPGSQTFADTRAHMSARSARQREPRRQHGLALLHSRYPRLLPQAIAASLVLILGAGTLTAAAAAGPGSFLFPLHRLEQGVQLGLSGSAADRFKLHLAYAGDALTTLDGMRANSSNTARDSSAYAQALTMLRDEEHAAENELASVSDSAQHDALATQLQAFKSRAIHDLYVVLSSDASLSWQNRVATTQVLGQLGAQVPHIDSVRISHVLDTTHTGDSGDSSRDTQTWKVTISGAGFTPGAVVVIDGHVAGTVTELSPTQIVALVKSDDAAIHAAAIGIEAPDGSAAQAARGILGEDDHSGSSSATATPSDHSGDGDSHSGDTHGGKGTGQNGTPTPTSTTTPQPGN